jgi:hypothetical protein
MDCVERRVCKGVDRFYCYCMYEATWAAWYMCMSGRGIIAMRRSRAEVLGTVDVELCGQWEGC